MGGFKEWIQFFKIGRGFSRSFQIALIATVAQGIRGTPRYFDERSVGTH